MAKRKASEPVWWRWKLPQIEAAEREPEKYARELAEMREFMARKQAEIETCPGVRLYRQHAGLWPRLPAHELEHSLDEVLATKDAMQAYSAACAAKAKPRPKWHAKAKAEARRLIETGTPRRNVAGKLARHPQFATIGVKAIRAALK